MTIIIMVVTGIITALCIWGLIAVMREFDSTLLVYASASLLLCGTAFFYTLYLYLKPSPSLTVDAEGILDRSSLTAAGRVRREEITGIEQETINGINMIAIRVYDTKAFLARLFFLKRWMIRFNQYYTDGREAPIYIVGLMLDVPLDWLYEQMTIKQALWANNEFPEQDNERLIT
jgi:hypothetical protein